jgi:hypothetical protein
VLHRWQALRQFLSLHCAPDRPAKVADPRDSVRVPTRLEVSFASDHERIGCPMIHISRGGVFVPTDHLRALKSRFTPNLHVDSARRDLSVPVEVVSVGSGLRSRAINRASGCVVLRRGRCVRARSARTPGRLRPRRVVPAQVGPTLAYHEWIHVVSGDEVIDVGPVDLRGG